MSEAIPGFNPEAKRKLTREEVESILALTEDREALESFDLSDLNLSGLNLSNRSFRGCDARGISLGPKFDEDGQIIEGTNAENADWTDAFFESYGPYANFMGIEANNSVFGFGKTLYQQRNQTRETAMKNPSLYLGFDGRRGKFKNCKWKNIDFQGGSQFGTMFNDADLSGSEFDGCDLREFNWTDVKIDGIKITIYDPDSLNRLMIYEDQAQDLINAINFHDEAYKDGFEAERAKQKPEDLLYNFLMVQVFSQKK